MTTEEKKWGGKRPGAGKKKSLPEGARDYHIQMTPEEREQVKEFLKKLRSK